jgi:Ca-activated chloride channel homolog
VLVIALSATASGLLASRPVSSEVTQPQNYSRDIVLCLDVSGSMVEYDAEVIRQFEALAKEFAGERIALVLWSSSAVQTFPLTDDYDYLVAQLALVREGMELSVQDDYSGYPYWNGTLVAEGASLIGDGVASCVMSFDRLDTRRSRTIILATDNVINGEPLVTLEEAGEYATEREVRIFSINPTPELAPSEARELEEVSLDTGGGYYELSDTGAVPRIVDGLLEEQATAIESAPTIEYTDVPGGAYGWAVFGFLVLLVVAWRVRL